jgi:CubicO group peptidase (beta-lactamase class C family)
MDIDEAALAEAVARNQFSGVVALTTGDEPPWQRAYGFAHRALGVPNAVDTRFALASGSKTFTALAVLHLVDSGLIGLDSPVRPILGADLPLVDDAVTVEHLLAHTSGIGDYLDEEADWDAEDYVLPVPVHTLDETSGFLPVLDGFPQAFPPGDHFTYNNGGYVVLAIIAERVSGRGYHDLVRDAVFERAGMAGADFLRSNDLPGDAALGYLRAEGNLTNVLHLPIRGNGDGGAYAAADDLHRFWLALLAGRIVGDEVVTEMIRPRFDVPAEGLRYGLGMWLHATGPALVMEGYDAGVSMRSIHDPGSGTTATVLGNTSEGAWPVARLLLDAF